jgi:hypothetical protein
MILATPSPLRRLTKWSEAVSLASRRVVFQRNVKTLDDYLNQLVGILSHSVAA